jgi:radical SAM protein with 4Fe4S-binding SPASM domain
MELYHKIINEATTIPQVSLLKLCGLGEPLLDRLLDDRVLYAKTHLTIPIQVFTNGILLSPERADRLFAAGLDHIVVSLNANTTEQHRRIIGVPEIFETVCRNIDHLLSSGYSASIHAVITGDTFTDADADIFRLRWGSRGYVRRDTHSGAVANPAACCWRALQSIYVMYDGKVTPCCEDGIGRMLLGDLTYQTIREVYNSDRYVKFREDHSENHADRHDLCRQCVVPR